MAISSSRCSLASIYRSKKVSLFLNISFLFLLLCLSLSSTSYLHPNHNSKSPNQIPNALHDGDDDGCANLHHQNDIAAKCLYVKTQIGCKPDGYLSYLKIFYCNLGQLPVIGHIAIIVWLIVLFYLLGNTASNYFCSSLESLSSIMNLSPTIAGVTLLSLGNGAPDVFSSIASFTSRSGDGDVGLNSVLGGAFFVSSVVAGVISIVISPQRVTVDESGFIKDVLFFLFSLASLLVIIFIGRINLWGSIAFLAIYFVYVGTVWATEILKTRRRKLAVDVESTETLVAPLLREKEAVDDEKVTVNVTVTDAVVDHDSDEEQAAEKFKWWRKLVVYLLELPLSLPRRVTIPVVNEEEWSKPYAVISVTLAPVFLSAILNTQSENMGARSKLAIYLGAAFTGVVLGTVAYFTTKRSGPPTAHTWPWLVGGFAMSVAWTYITAEELVCLLESYGLILGISPSILGLTILAWGNSLGDLIANVAMAVTGGPDGAQIAITGCYAGPMFNTLVGLGLSFVLSAWSEYPSSFVIPVDNSLYETVAFLMAGLLWALVILPSKKMRLDGYLGAGLVAIYLCFLLSRLATTLL